MFQNSFCKDIELLLSYSCWLKNLRKLNIIFTMEKLVIPGWVQKTNFRRLNWSYKILIVSFVLGWILFNSSCSNKNQMELTNDSAYVNKVYDYKYAPGQHASLIPKDWKGDDFVGKPWINGKIYTSLGGWGGYIIAGFDHTINNRPGKDFAVYTQPGPASEPAVVYVMPDTNGDGVPNDGEWIELKGSEYNNSETIRNYQVTYTKPTGNGNVTWRDNQGNHGELIPVFTSSSWWWQGYGDQTEVTFSGVKLPNAYENISTQADVENWAVRPGLFTYGYAECYGNQDSNADLKANLFDISNALDAAGNPVILTGIRFIKVQSAVFQVAGWLNEISTEVSGAVDLSMIEVK
jgi:hypothetical protein